MPVALNCNVNPAATVGVLGDTAKDSRFGGATVNVSVPDTLVIVAVIVLVPAATAVTNPDAEIVALLVSLDVHVTVDEMSFWLPSL